MRVRPGDRRWFQHRLRQPGADVALAPGPRGFHAVEAKPRDGLAQERPGVVHRVVVCPVPTQPGVLDNVLRFGSFYRLSISSASTSVVRVETPEFVSFVQSRFPNSLAAKFFALDPPAAAPTTAFSTVAQVRTKPLI